MGFAENRAAYDPLDFNCAGFSVVFLVVDGIIFWIIVILIESKVFRKLK